MIRKVVIVLLTLLAVAMLVQILIKPKYPIGRSWTWNIIDRHRVNLCLVRSTKMSFITGWKLRAEYHVVWGKTDPRGRRTPSQYWPGRWIRRRLGFGYQSYVTEIGVLHDNGVDEISHYDQCRLVYLPSWVPVVLFAIYPSIAFIRGPVRRYRRRIRGRCFKCGYSLIGNTSGVCPECGTTIERPAPGSWTGALWRWVRGRRWIKARWLPKRLTLAISGACLVLSVIGAALVLFPGFHGFWSADLMTWSGRSLDSEENEQVPSSPHRQPIAKRKRSKSARRISEAEAKVLAETKAFLDRGGQVDGVNERGQTRLHEAASKGYEHVAGLLIDKGADLSAGDTYGNTALHTAVFAGHCAVVSVLIARGAAVNAPNELGLTPLHWAGVQGHARIVELLIAEGADVNTRDMRGRTPLSWAEIGKRDAKEHGYYKGSERRQRDAIIESLRRHGAKE